MIKNEIQKMDPAVKQRDDNTNNSNLKQHIHDFDNFPKEGVVFRDIMPLLDNPVLLKATIETLCVCVQKIQCNVIVGIESRGFLLGMPIAFHLEKSFVAARKKGKLPGDVAQESYALEYGQDIVEIQRSRIHPNKNYVIVDDLIATGGTALATARIIQNNGGHVSGFVFFIELSALQGRSLIKAEFPNIPCETVITY